MTEIMLTKEQTEILSTSSGPVVIRIPTGESVGSLDPHEQLIIAECKRRLASTSLRIPHHRVEAHMAALQVEWERTGGFDQVYMNGFLQKLREADAA